MGGTRFGTYFSIASKTSLDVEWVAPIGIEPVNTGFWGFDRVGVTYLEVPRGQIGLEMSGCHLFLEGDFDGMGKVLVVAVDFVRFYLALMNDQAVTGYKRPLRLDVEFAQNHR